MSARGQERDDQAEACRRARRSIEDWHRPSVAQLLRALTVTAQFGVVAAGCAEPPPGGPAIDPNDLDGDGIPNDEDLCPRSAHVSQHDEDGDGVGDACDVCPAVYDPLQLDTGEIQSLGLGDRVGDACDPQPARDGDKLAAFHAFDDEGDLRSWRGDGWMVHDDAAHVAGTARWEDLRVHRGDGLYVQARVAALTWREPSGGGHLGVTSDFEGTLIAGYRCGVVPDRDGDGNDEIELVGMTGAVTRTLGAPATGDLVITLWRAIDKDRNGFLFCRVSQGGGKDKELVLETDDTSTGRYALIADQVDASVTAAVVYTFPFNACTIGAKCNPGDPGT
jgi:hypothetical protein